MKKILPISILLCFIFSARAGAQWSVGLSGGWDYNWPSVSKGYATDVAYKGQSGFNAGIIGRYRFLDWLAVRADLRVDTRNYRMERNFYRLKDVFTNHRDTYLHLPVLADLSFGGRKLRGHTYLGGYVGYWLNSRRNGNAIQKSTINENLIHTAPFDEQLEFDSRRDVRFNAGLAGGLGISCLLSRKWEVMAEGLFLYDLTSSSKTYLTANPRYNSTMGINLGVMYNF